MKAGAIMTLYKYQLCVKARYLTQFIQLRLIKILICEMCDIYNILGIVHNIFHYTTSDIRHSKLEVNNWRQFLL